MISDDLKFKLVVVGAAGVGLYWMAKKVAGAAEGVVSNAAAAVSAAVTAPIVGLGEMMGIPATNQDQCSIDLANGDLWSASFSCTAGRYLKAAKNRLQGLPLDQDNGI